MEPLSVVRLQRNVHTIPVMTDQSAAAALQPLLGLRQHQRDGKRSPHKPLLALLALGQYAADRVLPAAWSARPSTSSRL